MPRSPLPLSTVTPAASRRFPLYHTRSPFARQASVVYALLIAFISLYPLSGWRDIGVSPLAFLSAPLPLYRTWFDLATNVLAYIPFGLLIVLAIYPHIRGVIACVLATCLGAAWSCGMEMLQLYLPMRVPSNLDLLLNTVGTFIGALFAMVRGPRLLLHSVLTRWRLRWLVQDASFGLILMGLWLLAQMQPQVYAFSVGDWTRPLLAWLEGWWPEPLTWLNWYSWVRLGRDDFVALETIVVAGQLSAVGLFLLTLLRPEAPRRRLLLCAGMLAVALKGLVERILFGLPATWAWLTPGVLTGCLMSGLFLLGVCAARPRVMLRAALLLLFLSMLLTNLAPVNLYTLARIEAWNPGPWLNLHGVLQALDWSWPVLAGLYLLKCLDRQHALEAQPRYGMNKLVKK